MRPLRGLQETRVATREESGVLGFPSSAPPRHAHGDLTSLAPHERLPEILVSAEKKLIYPDNDRNSSEGAIGRIRRSHHPFRLS